MPRVWRMRLVNIWYDAGKKVFADELFNFGGKNTLFNLANGGGKTLLVQLMLQTVLPNERLNKRRLSDLLQNKNFTGHIAVEWHLDSAEADFLLTGFCFTRGNDESGRLRYFMYTSHYKEANPYDIKHFPYVNDKRPLSYDELLKLLKNLKGSYFKVFYSDSKRSDYLRELSTYNLFEKEWRRIKETNNNEGGIDDFFNSLQSTDQLLDNLLIPVAEELFYDDVREQKESLVETFNNLKNKLLNIPEMERNLKDLALIREKGQVLLEALKERENARREFEERKVNLAMYSNSLEHWHDCVVEELKEIDEELESIERDETENRYLLESVKYSREYALVEEKRKELFEVSSKKDELYEVIQKTKRELNLSKAVNLWFEKNDLEAKNRALNESIDNMYLGKEEKLEKLMVYAATVYQRLNEEIEKLEQRLREVEEERIGKEKKKKILQERNWELNRQKNVITAEKTKLEMKIKEKNRFSDSLFELHKNERWQLLPDVALEELRSKLSRLTEGLKNLEDQRVDLEKETTKIFEELDKLKARKPELVEKIKAIDKEIQLYRKKRKQVGEVLRRHEISYDDLFKEKSLIELRLEKLQKELEEESFINKSSLQDFRNQLQLIERYDFYVPSEEVMKLKKYLEDSGVSCRTGPEWLKLQGFSDEKRIQYLKRFPLLPFSLVIFKEKLNRLVKLSIDVEKISGSYPVPIILLPKGLLEMVDDRRLLEIFEGQYIFWQKAHEYASSRASLDFVAAELEGKIERVKEVLNRIENSMKNLRGTWEIVHAFFADYAEDLESLRLPELKVLKAELEALEDREHELKRAEISAEERLSEIADEWKKLDSERANVEELIVKFERLIGLNNQAYEANKKLRKLREDEEKIDRELEYNNVAISKYDEEINEKHALKAILDKDLSDRRKEREFYREKGKGHEPVSLSLTEAMDSYKRLELELGSHSASIRQYEERIRENIKRIESLERKLSKFGFSEAEFEGSTMRVSDIQIEALEKKLGELEDEYAGLREEASRIQGLSEAQERNIENMKKRIVSEYSKEPILLEEPDEQEKRSKEDLMKLDMDRNRWMDIRRESERFEKLLGELIAKVSNSMMHYKVDRVDGGITDRSLKEVKEKISDEIDAVIDSIGKAFSHLEESKEKVRKAVGSFMAMSGEANSDIVAGFLNKMTYEDYFQFSYFEIKKAFEYLFGQISKYEKQIQAELAQNDKDKKLFVEDCVRRARRFAEEIEAIDSSSYIDYAGKRWKAVQIKLDTWDLPDMSAKMEIYINRCIEELKTIPDEKPQQFDYIKNRLSSKNLLNVITNLRRCRVRVLKPEARAEHSTLQPWDSIQKWSGGEKYAAYAAMFIAVISHIRKKKSNLSKPWKVLIADNLFGKASSAHILEYVFQILERNRVQLIALTDHTKQTIYSYFPVVYSLKLRSYSNRDYVLSTLEKGYYDIAPLEEELRSERQESLW